MEQVKKNNSGTSEEVEKTVFRKPVKRNDERRAEEKVDPNPPKSVPVEGGSTGGEPEPPIAIYQEVKGVPYTAVYFEIENIWDSPDVSYREDVEAIEDYYRQKVASGEIQDSKDAFKDLIRQAERATDSKNAPLSVKIAKIAEFVKFMSRLEKIERDRRRWQS